MYMLMNGLFDDAKQEFKVFLDKVPTLKHRLMYIMFIFSELMKFDLINPSANLKKRVKELLNLK